MDNANDELENKGEGSQRELPDADVPGGRVRAGELCGLERMQPGAGL